MASLDWLIEEMIRHVSVSTASRQEAEQVLNDALKRIQEGEWEQYQREHIPPGNIHIPKKPK